jgi:hypothetical protein
VICPKCTLENREDSNFCSTCGTKLNQTCLCWVKKGEPYNCGQDECPGYRLPLVEKKSRP